MTYNAVSDVSVSFADPADLIASAVASQAEGVGGSGNDYQTTCDVTISSSVGTGGFFCRVISNYDSGTDTKSGIFTEFGTGGWPIRIRKSDFEGQAFTVSSTQTLAAGTAYTTLVFYIGPDYFDDLDAATTASGANTILSNADAAGQLWPSGANTAATASNTVTIAGTTTPATNISGNFSIPTGASAGTIIGTATADRTNGTFSEGTPALSWVDVSSSGQLSITSGQTAPAVGSYSIQLTYDNSAVTGGGTYSETVTINVTEVTTGETAGYIPAPTQNAASFATLSALEAALTALESNWNTEMTGYGLATTGVEPVFTLQAGSHGNVGTWTYDFSAHEHVHVRAEGSFSRNDYTPTGGTKLGRVRWDNCRKLNLWLMDMKPATVSTTRYNETHWMRNCQDCNWYRNAVGGDVAESASDMENRIKDGVWFLVDIRGSSNCGFYNNTFIGARSGFFGSAGNDAITATGIIWQGNVFDQLSDDFFQLYGDHAVTNCVSRNNVGCGPNPKSRQQAHRLLAERPNGCGSDPGWKWVAA